MDLRAGLNAVEKRTFLTLTELVTTSPPAILSVAIHCTDYAILVPVISIYLYARNPIVCCEVMGPD
jgi:hypothetical protein